MIKRYDVCFAKETNGKVFWSKVGAAFLNNNGTGYNLILDSIPAPVNGSYRLNLFEPKETGSTQTSEKQESSSPPNSRPGSNRDFDKDGFPF